MPENYADFVAALLKAGFSLAGGNPHGTYCLIPFTWEEQQQLPPQPLCWHSEDPETDPWEWRMRVLQERSDIAYGRLFFRVGGYITREWYPKFLAVRRGGADFETCYQAGRISHAARRIYTVLDRCGPLLLPELKAEAAFGREEQQAFNRALGDLQMGLFLTICGQARRHDRYGREFGWNCTRLCTVEQFWDEAVFAEAAELDADEAAREIEARLRTLNPAVKPAAVRRFLYG